MGKGTKPNLSFKSKPTKEKV
ncbi:uncharacterized protein G2W53_023390 [Senna tora]|uniref:Uncharacterized protein n=1 Tax=Senna tora TaxID=362788 RepID=A0A834TA01_9FABA|nr:uncharacterized protein G2W53_041778 [Senna tora]KAF7817935.1 uncharacterized protein G2W53_023390 [Senna tora]